MGAYTRGVVSCGQYHTSVDQLGLVMSALPGYHGGYNIVGQSNPELRNSKRVGSLLAWTEKELSKMQGDVEAKMKMDQKEDESRIGSQQCRMMANVQPVVVSPAMQRNLPRSPHRQSLRR